MKKATAIIQARMGSTRLPGKVLSDICGHPMLWHIINRVKYANLIDKIIIATTKETIDDDIVKFAKYHKISVFRGSSYDVLDRYYQTAKYYRIKDIVRITADDPLKDPKVIDKVIKSYFENNADYSSNTVEPTYPLGLDTEVFSYETLEKTWKETNSKYDREHVTAYIYNNPSKFNIVKVQNENKDLSHLRWTVDTKEDLDFVRVIYRELYKDNKIFLMDDILNLIKSKPDLVKK